MLFSLQRPLTRYVKLRLAHTLGMPGKFFPPPRVSDRDMHHGTCVTHVPWSVSSCFPWNRWRGKRSRHSRRVRNPQFYVSGQRPMTMFAWFCDSCWMASFDSFGSDFKFDCPLPVEGNLVRMVTSSWQQAITRTWGGDYWANFLRSAIFQFSKYMLAIEYHVHILQVSPQLSWGDTSHISKWFNEPNRYSCNINFFLTEKFSNGDLSNSIPALIKTLGTKWYNQIQPDVIWCSMWN